jgi:hypothetical protein
MGSESKNYHSSDLCRKLWVEVAEEVNEPCFTTYLYFQDWHAVFFKRKLSLCRSLAEYMKMISNPFEFPP